MTAVHRNQNVIRVIINEAFINCLDRFIQHTAGLFSHLIKAGQPLFAFLHVGDIADDRHRPAITCALLLNPEPETVGQTAFFCFTGIPVHSNPTVNPGLFILVRQQDRAVINDIFQNFSEGTANRNHIAVTIIMPGKSFVKNDKPVIGIIKRKSVRHGIDSVLQHLPDPAKLGNIDPRSDYLASSRPGFIHTDNPPIRKDQFNRR